MVIEECFVTESIKGFVTHSCFKSDEAIRVSSAIPPPSHSHTGSDHEFEIGSSWGQNRRDQKILTTR